MNTNIFKQDFHICRNQRQKLMNQKSILVWFTGLSGSGKSTVANALESKLHALNFKTYTLDGDNIRGGLNKNLTFSDEDRSENIRRIAEVSKLFLDAGTIVIACFVSPFEKDRELVREIVGSENYVEVFVDTPIEECEKRDIKGLYKKARLGEIKDFTGISSPYEAPKNPDILIDTSKLSIEKSVNLIFEKINDKIKLNE